MLSRKKTVSTFAMVLMLVCLCACGSRKSENAVKIAIWTSDEAQIRLLGSFVDEYAAKKGITVDYTFESIDFAEYNTKLMLQMQGQDAPDLYWITDTAAKAYIASGNLAVLNDSLSEYDVSDFAEGAMRLWKEGDDIYAVPFSTSPIVLFYNADLFAKAGAKTPEEYVKEGNWTWENFRLACKQIKDNTGVWGFQTIDGQGYTSKVFQNLLPIIRSYDADAWDEEGKVIIDTKEAVDAVRLFHDMVYEDGSVVPPGDESSFYTGMAAMTVAQISRLSNLDGVDWKWSVCALPGDSPVIGQAAWGVNAKSPKAALAKDIVAYITNKECVSKMAGIWPPARKSVLESEDFLTSNSRISAEQMKNAVAASIETGEVLPSHERYPQIEVEARMVYDKLWNADADIESVMHEVADVYRKYIN